MRNRIWANARVCTCVCIDKWFSSSFCWWMTLLDQKKKERRWSYGQSTVALRIYPPWNLFQRILFNTYLWSSTVGKFPLGLLFLAMSVSYSCKKLQHYDHINVIEMLSFCVYSTMHPLLERTLSNILYELIDMVFLITNTLCRRENLFFPFFILYTGHRILHL